MAYTLNEFDWGSVATTVSDLGKQVITTYGQVAQTRAQVDIARAQAKSGTRNITSAGGGYPASGGMDTTTMLMLGAAAVGVVVLMKKKGR